MKIEGSRQTFTGQKDGRRLALSSWAPYISSQKDKLELDGQTLYFDSFRSQKPFAVCFHLVVWRHGLLEHVPDQVVCVLGDEAVHPPQGGPRPVGEVHRDNGNLWAVILPELGLETLPQWKIDLKFVKVFSWFCIVLSTAKRALSSYLNLMIWITL